MRYLRFRAGGKERFGVGTEDEIREITPHYFGPYRATRKKYALSKVKLLVPCVPSKIVAVGLNYRAHAKELGMKIPPNPIIFLKPPTALLDPGDAIRYPRSSRQVDYEGELGIVIKKKARNVTVKNAKNYILGYTCINDVTARDLQKKDGQWTRAKSFDTFAPVGPWIVSGIDPDTCAIETRVNGVPRQSSRTLDMIFSVAQIVSFVSGVMTLEPGDIIATGTPPGVGPLKVGDTVAISIEGIGELINTVKKGI